MRSGRVVDDRAAVVEDERAREAVAVGGDRSDGEKCRQPPWEAAALEGLSAPARSGLA